MRWKLDNNLKNSRCREPNRYLMPPVQRTMVNIYINLILPETIVRNLHFFCRSILYLNVRAGLRNTHILWDLGTLNRGTVNRRTISWTHNRADTLIACNVIAVIVKVLLVGLLPVPSTFNSAWLPAARTDRVTGYIAAQAVDWTWHTLLLLQ